MGMFDSVRIPCPKCGTVSDFEVVADSVFFQTPAGVYQRDGTGAVSLYSAAPVDVVPVVE